MSQPLSGMSTPCSESKLAELLSDLIDRNRRGQPPDLEGVARQHPELAEELRELWEAAQIAEMLAPPPADWTTCDHLTTISPVPLPASSSEADAAPRASIPHTIVGDCELREELGRGGMGVVYRAWQPGLGRVVALKMLLSGPLAVTTERGRFRAEAEASASLDHPHIVPVFAVGDHQGQPYFLMKLVEGTTLARRLADGPLPPRAAAALLAPVCRAVEHAHRRGVLHRDLKPSNILIDCDGQPFVSDFGLAKRLDTQGGLTRTGAIVGTPGYLAPEQAAGSRGHLGPASDVYGLGAILYHMLTGRPPFQAASPIDTVFMTLEQDPLPPRLLNPKADRDLEMIALKCLQKPADLRYPTAQALAEDLEAYLAGEPISARSGRFSAVASRLLGETHHAAILENWGLLWIWHSLVLLVLCLTTNALHWRGLTTPEPYLALWVVGIGTWASIFWALRRRSGPVSFVERQIAHAWAGSVISCILLFVVEILLGLPVLRLSPVLALIAGMVFVIKAGILSGTFYLQAGALFLTAAPMAWWPEFGLAIFGIVSAACYFLPGLKYHRQRGRAVRIESSLE
ncbi:serine/threonine-protein kinase [soil metagenome]